jgi:hypothetical protein
MSFGSEKKETKHAFSFSSQKSQYTNLLQVSQQGPYGDSCPFTRPFFYISLKFLIKISLNKDIFSFLSKAPRKERPPMFPQSGAPMKTDAHFYSLT